MSPSISAPRSSTWLARSIVVALCVALIAGFIAAPFSLGSLGLGDFRAYWSSARVLVQGGNPYDRPSVAAAYFEGGPDLGFDPAWNPPWLQLLLSPLGLLPVTIAGRVWAIINLAILGLAPLGVWRLLRASPDDRAPAWLVIVGLTFGASLTAIAVGQVAPLVLLGFVLALVAVQRGRDSLAGAALLLTLAKPQLSYLALPLILIWAARQRRWRILLGLLVAGVLTVLCVTVMSPAWLSGYRSLVGSYDFFRHSAATIGGFVQAYFGVSLLRFAGVLALLALPLLLRLSERRDLLTGLNAALLISLPLAPYGWSFDQVVLLPAIVQIIFWLRHTSDARRFLYAAVLAAIYVVWFALKAQAGVGDFLFVWAPLALGLLYALTMKGYGTVRHAC